MRIRELATFLRHVSMAMLIGTSAFAGSSQSLVYQGRIVRPDSSPVNAGVVSFTLSVYSPSPQKCLLYSETQSINMAGSLGMFSLPLGAGTRTDGGSHSFSKVFTNGATLTGLICADGSTSYTASATEDRDLAVSFNDAGTVVNLSSMSIKSVPFALQAHEIDGWGLNNLVKVSSIGSPTTFTTAEMANVKMLGAAACATNEILKWNGSGWLCSTDVSGGSPTDATYAAKGVVQADTDLATSGLSLASGVLKVNYGTGANQIVKLDASSKLPAVDGSALTNISATNVSAGTLSITHGGTGSGTKTAAFDNLSPNTTKGDLIVSDGTNNIRLPRGSDGQVLTTDSAQTAGVKWANVSAGTVTSVTAGTGLTGGTITSTGTLAVNVGTGANQIVQLDASSKLPTVDGSALTNLSTSQISAGTLAVSKGGTGNSTFPAHAVIVSNLAGDQLSGLNCTSGQVVTFDASGYAICGAGGTSGFVNGGNSFSAAAILGTNDNNTLSFETNNSTRMTIDTSGNVGIGTSAPGYTLDVQSTNTSTAASNVPTANFKMTVSPTANVTGPAKRYAAGASATVPGANTFTIPEVLGTWSSADNSGSGTVTNVNGGRFYSDNYGDTTNVIGVRSTGENNGTSNTTAGFAAEAYNYAGTTTNLVGLSVYLEQSGGTVTNRYGIKINPPSGTATNDYGIYQDGGQQNYFAGNVGIGITAPSTKLHLRNGGITLDGAQPASSGTIYMNEGFPAATDGKSISVQPWLNGNVTNVYGVDLNAANPSGFSMTNYTGLRVGLGGGLATGNNRGIEVNSLPAGASNYALYSSALAQSYFAGSVGIGTASPGAPLDVKGEIRMSGATSGYAGLKSPATGPSVTWTLPTVDGSAGQFLKTDGSGNLSWATSAGAPSDATYAAKGIVQFDTDAATSGISLSSGVAKVNYGTGANQIVQLDGSSKLPAVDGSALTNLNANNIASGTLPISRGGTGASSFAANNLVGTNGTGSALQAVTCSQNQVLSFDASGNYGCYSLSTLAGGTYFANGGNSFAGTASLGTNDNNNLAFETNNTVAMTIDTTGKVGIGTTSPGYMLTVNETSAATSGQPETFSVVQTVSPSAASSAWYIPAYIQATSGGTNKNITAGIVAMMGETDWNDTSTLSSGSGIEAVMKNTSSGTVNNAIGVDASMNNDGAGTVVAAIGVQGYVNSQGTGAITTAMGGNFEVNQSSGTITTGIGVHIGTVQGATKYSLYAGDTTAPSYFAGSVGIGTNNPGAPLDVQGEIRMSGATSGYAGLKSPAVGPSVTWTLPTADGSAGQFLKTDGSGNLSWAAASSSGITSINGSSVTAQSFAAPGTSGTAPAWSTNTGTGVHTLNIPMASTASVTAGLLSKTDYDAFNTKLGTSTSFSGDVSGTYDATSVDKIKGTALSISALTSGNFLKYNGSAWVNANLASGDITTALGYTPVNKAGDTMSGSLDMDGKNVTNVGTLSLKGSTSGTLTMTVPATVTSYSLNWPSAVAGSNGQVLASDTSGNLSWATVASAANTFANGGNSFGANATLGTNDNFTLGFETNNSTRVTIDTSGNLGIGTTAPDFTLSIGDGVANDGAFIAKGYGTVGTDGQSLTAAGAGTRMIWYPKKAAFRVGGVNGVQWDDTSIGNYSMATGYNTTASGFGSTAIGSSNEASGLVSLALGNSTIASGVYSTAMGGSTTASGGNSTTMGQYTTAESFAQTTIGRYNLPKGGETGGSWVATDPLFVVGNGTASGSKSNALMILKNGNVGIGNSNPQAPLDVKGEIRMTGATSGYAGFKSPAVGPSVTWTLPTVDGSSGQFLKTDGSGNLSWASASSVSITSINGSSVTAQSFAAPGTSGTAPAWSTNTGTGVHTLNIPMASAASVTAGLLSKTDYDAFNTKLGTSTSFSGDVSGTYDATSVDKIKNVVLSISAIASGNFLKYNGSAWVNSNIGATDISSGTLPVTRGGTGTVTYSSNALVMTNGTGTAFTSLTCSTGEIAKWSGTAWGCVADDQWKVDSNNNLKAGTSALAANTTGTNNVAIGISALSSSTAGQYNVAIGESSQANMSIAAGGTPNVSIGYQALMGSATVASNTGEGNVAFGYQALNRNTSGTDNFASGHQALFNNSTGNNNYAIGAWSLLYNTTGDNNIAFGWQAATSNETGLANIAFGTSALANNKLSDVNIAIGQQAQMNMQNGAGGGGNIAIGRQAIRGSATPASNGGAWNIGIGDWALQNLTSGDYNIAIGNNPLQNTTTGLDNVAIGDNALVNNTVANRNIAIGYYAQNRMQASGDSDNIAIGSVALQGSATPANNTGTQNVAIGQGAMQSITSGTSNLGAGDWAMMNLTSGNNNVALGFQAGYINATNGLTTGSNNTFLGSNSGFGSATQQTYATAVGADATVTSSSTIVLGRAATDRVVIGQTANQSTYKFYVKTDGTNTAIGGSAAWTNTSDGRFKTNVEPIQNALDVLGHLQGVRFDWDHKKYPNQFEKGRQIGFIAQQIEPYVPEIVRTDENGYKGVQYSQLVALLTEAVKELYGKFLATTGQQDRRLASLEDAKQKLENENKDLKSKNQELEERLERIEKQLRIPSK